MLNVATSTPALTAAASRCVWTKVGDGTTTVLRPSTSGMGDALRLVRAEPVVDDDVEVELDALRSRVQLCGSSSRSSNQPACLSLSLRVCFAFFVLRADVLLWMVRTGVLGRALIVRRMELLVRLLGGDASAGFGAHAWAMLGREWRPWPDKPTPPGK